MFKKLIPALLACLLVLSPAVALAQKPLQGALARSVPEDVFLFVHAVSVPEDDFAEQAWGRFWQAVLDSGIPGEVFSLLSGAVEGAQGATFQEHLQKVRALTEAIDWKALASKEFVYAMRFDPNHVLATMTKGIGPPDCVWMMRGDSSDKNSEALAGAFEYLSSFSEQLVLTKTRAGGELRVQLLIANMQMIQLFQKDDLIVISMGSGLLDDCLLGLSGAGKALVDSDAFKKAFATLPPPVVSAAYSDMTGMWAMFGEMIGRVFDKAEAEAGGGEEAAQLAIARRVLDLARRELRLLGTSADVVRVEGVKIIRDGVMFFDEGYEESIIYKSFLSGRQLTDWHRHVPFDATSFSASTGGDMVAAYDETINLIKLLNPDGKGDELVAMWDGLQEQHGVNVRDDILSVIAGDTITFSLQKSGLTENAATLIRVSDEARAKALLSKLIGTADGFLKQSGQSGLIRRPTSGLGEDFESVTHPQVMMFGLSFIVGVRDGWLYLAYSEEAVKSSLAVASGDAKSVLDNPDFQKRAIDIGEGVSHVSYQDLSRIGQEVAAGLAAGTMVGGMVSSQPDFPKELKKVFSIMGRLVGPLQQINFLDSKVGVIVHHTDHIRTTTVTAYKETVVAK